MERRSAGREEKTMNKNVRTELEAQRDLEIKKLREAADRLAGLNAEEYLARGVSIEDVGPELANRMRERGWEHIEYDSCKPGWRARGNSREWYVMSAGDFVL